MLLSHRKNGVTSLCKEVTGFSRRLFRTTGQKKSRPKISEDVDNS